MKKILKLTLLFAVIIVSTSNMCLAREFNVFFRGTITYFDPNEGHVITKKFGFPGHPEIIIHISNPDTISKSQLKQAVSNTAEIPNNMFRIIMRGRDMDNLSNAEFENALQPGARYSLTNAKTANKARQ